MQINAGVPDELTQSESATTLFSRTAQAGHTTLVGGTVDVFGTALIEAADTVSVLAGGDVQVEAYVSDAGSTTPASPHIISTPHVVKVVTGYVQVPNGTIQVPQTNWVDTTVTRQTGTDTVVVGSQFDTVQIKLVQAGYWNATTKTEREWFVAGVDYNLGNIPDSKWGSVPRPGFIDPADNVRKYINTTDNSLLTFKDLTPDQRTVVLNFLGYKPLYDLQASDLITWKTQDGVSSQTTPVNPGWTGPTEVVSIDADGWRERYIRMPVSAEAELKNQVLKVVSQGDPTDHPEIVGQYRDTANVAYTQIASSLESHWESKTVSEPNANPWESTSKTIYYYVTDKDGQPGRWNVTYSDTGLRETQVYDEAATRDVSYGHVPVWFGDPTNGQVSGDLLSQAKSGYYTTTASVTNINTRAVHPGVFVGTDNGSVYHQRSYKLQTDGTDFFTAVHRAYNRSDAPGGSFLAEPLTAQQNTSIWYKIPDGWSAWIGGVRDGNGTYYWLRNWSGGTFDDTYHGVSFNDYNYMSSLSSYRNWAGGEPNNYGGHEVSVMMFGDYRKGSNGNYGAWNDIRYYNQFAYVVQYEPYQTGANAYETEYDYNKYWTSNWTQVTDQRLTSNYQWVGQSQDIIGQRPHFETVHVQVPVVTNQTVTVWKTQPVTENRVVYTTERVYEDGSAHRTGAFDSDSISAANKIHIEGQNVSLSGKLAASGAAGAVEIVAGADATVQGNAPAGTTGAIAATAQITSSGNIDITAHGTATVGDAGRLQVGAGGTGISVHGDVDALVQGAISAPGAVTVTAGRDVELQGTVTTADATIGVTAGRDVTGDINAVLASGSGDINLTAQSGNIELTDSSLTSTGTIRLKAEAGSVSAALSPNVTIGNANYSAAVINANLVYARAQSGITADTMVAHADAETTGAGGIALNNGAAIALDRVVADNGGVSVTALGDITATNVQTLGTSAANSISLSALHSPAGVAGNLQVVSVTAASNVTLLARGLVTETPAGVLSGDLLSVTTGGALNLRTNVNALSVQTTADGSVTIDQSADARDLVLSNVSTFNGAITVSSGGKLIADNVRSARNAATNNIRLTSTGDLNVGFVDAGVYAASAAEATALLAGSSATTLTSIGDVTLIAGGSIGRSASADPSAVNLVADQLTAQAHGSIGSLNTAINTLTDATSATGSIDLADRDGYAEQTPGLAVMLARSQVSSTGGPVHVNVAAQGDLSIGRLDPDPAHPGVPVVTPGSVAAPGPGSTVRLASASGNLVVQSGSTLTVAGGITLLAGGQVKAPSLPAVSDRIEIRAGTTIEIPSPNPFSLTANTIILETGPTLVVNGTLSARDLVELTSDHGDVVINSTVKGIGSGSLTQLNVFALGTAITDQVVIDPFTGRPHYENPSTHLVYTADPGTNVAYAWQEATHLRFAFTAFNSVTGVVETFYSSLGTSNNPADGQLYYADNTTAVVAGDRAKIGTLTPKYTALATSLSDLVAAGTLKPVTVQVQSGNVYYRGDTALANVKAGQISLTAAGGVIQQDTNRRLDADTLTARAVSGIDLNTAVGHANLRTTGSGNITLNETDGVTLDNVTALNGKVNVVAGGAITATQVESSTDVTGNDIALTANGGDINVGVAAAGILHGKITLKASGDIKEQQPPDSDIDIAAHTVDLNAGPGHKAYIAGQTTPATTYDLEVSTTQQILTDLVVSVIGDYVLNQDVRGFVDVTATGTIFVQHVTSGSHSIKLHAGNNVAVSDLVGAGGTVEVTAGGTIYEGDQNHDDIDLTADSAVLTAGANIGAGVLQSSPDLDISVGTLTATATAGAIGLNQSGSVSVAGLTAGTAIVLHANAGGGSIGAINLTGNVHAGTSVTLDADAGIGTTANAVVSGTALTATASSSPRRSNRSPTATTPTSRSPPPARCNLAQ